MDLAVVLAAAQDDAADLVPAMRPSRRDYSFAILAAVQSLDLPDVRLHSRRLQFLDRLHHQTRTQFEVVGPLVSMNAVELEFLGRNQQLDMNRLRP